MALNASESNAAASAPPIEESPPQTGSLPTKRGEFGYREDIHGQASEDSSSAATGEVIVLPARHPADRDAPTSGESTSETTSISALPTTTTTTSSITPHDTPSVNPSRQSIMSFFRPRKDPSYGGMHMSILLLIAIQVLLIGGTVIAWVFSTKRLNRISGSGMQTPEIGVIVHVMFGVALLGQLIMLERCFFRLRAERYAYLHPGEMLPTSRRLSSSSANLRLAPWLRPSLPTYAATLAASGHGTGDVEDHIIAAPPPPAYGNTRGSTLILSGFLRESLRAQRPRSSSSDMSWKSERPVSYFSHDDQRSADAGRVTRLEETLARLEEGSRSDDAVAR